MAIQTHKVVASAIQEQFWLIHSLVPEQSGYNIPLLFSLRGNLDVDLLQKSLVEIVDHHEIFRTVFSSDDGILLQLIRSEVSIPFAHHDLSGQGFTLHDEAVQGLIQAEVDRPFDLTEGPLLRCLLIDLADGSALLLFVMHHIITDLHSYELFVRELSRLYSFESSGRSMSRFESSSPLQYREYALLQRHWLESDEYQQMLTSWQNSLAQRQGYLNLPFDRLRPPVESYNGGACSLDLAPDLVKKLKYLAKQRNVNLFLLLLASYYVLLYRYSNQTEVIVGVPFTNRRKAINQDIMGCFVNILPIAVDIDPTMSFADLLQVLRTEMLTAHRRQEVPFKEIVYAAQERHNSNYNPFFQVGFTFQPPVQLELQDIQVRPESVRSSDIQLDLFPVLWEDDDAVSGFVEFNSDLFQQDTIARFVEHWQVLLADLADGTNVPLSRLAILADKERLTLLETWNATEQEYPQHTCLHTLFEEQVQRTPTAQALFVDDFSLTYEELNRRANQLGHYLQRHGVGSDTLVGVFMERSLEMIIALYGILKAGGAYVPLDPSYPTERLTFMIEDADLAVVLTQSHVQDGLPVSKAKVVSLDLQWPLVAQEKSDAVPSEVKADNLAYVIYTSGSTGKPKGAMNQHDAICNRLFWMQDEFQLQGSDRVLQKTPYSFDVSVWEFFWPLQVGASLVMAPPESHYDPAALIRLIESFAITTIHFVPSMLQAFLDAPGIGRCQSLKRLICSGEVLSYDLQKKVFSRLQLDLYNLYGPTEAAVDVTAWHCRQEYERQIVPIGRPIANTKIYIVDEFLQPTPIGVPGELLIGGVQVARGYLQREELSAVHFIDDIFSNKPGTQLYRSGDLARFLPDGTIEYLGRLDHQVKLHGLRIELGEIEAIIADHAVVQQAVAAMVDMVSGSKALVAYVVAENDQQLSAQEIAQEIKSYLAQKIPCYMVPAYVVLVPSLPLTASGKVDRKALPLPTGLEEVGVKGATTSDKVELQLYQIWEEILHHGEIRLTDNFFDVGGNSLLAVLLVSKINQDLQREIPVVKFFQYPTIESFAKLMATGHETSQQEAVLQSRSQRQRAALAVRKRARGR